MADEGETVLHVAICGGGLVGTLCACYMAQKGFTVDVFEKMPDVRTERSVSGRTISLGLSTRGREALKKVGLEQEVVQRGVPMFSRMIHDKDGNLSSQVYGINDQNVVALDRKIVNEVLLNAAEKYPNVSLYFEHKVTQCDFDTGELTLLCSDQEVKKKVDLIIGCDGAYSAVRQQMIKRPDIRFSYKQEYITHGYMELGISSGEDNQFAMEKNCLHVWPRDKFMMLAAPNLDKTFTAMLCMPYALFDAIQTENQLMDFFRINYQDAIHLIGEANLKSTFFRCRLCPLMTIKCYPYHVGNRAVIIGDAAHTMVPFYGQGMNCGFEDCLILSQFLDEHNNDLGKVLSAYTDYRHADAQAMCDLSMEKYAEMRSHDNLQYFLLRTKLDSFLYTLFPTVWIPVYTTILRKVAWTLVYTFATTLMLVFAYCLPAMRT